METRRPGARYGLNGLLTAVVLAVLAGCTAGDSPAPAADVNDSEPNAQEEQLSNGEAEDAGTAAEPTIAERAPDDVAGVAGDPVEAWIAVWEGAELVAIAPDSARQIWLGHATPEVAAQIETIYNPTVDSEAASTPRTFENHPVASEIDDGRVQIDDCLFESPRIGNATIWYSGTAQVIEGQWRIVALELRSEVGCVPAGIAEEAIAGYEAYWDARVSFWQPADPTSPLLEQTMTGIHLDLIRGLLTEHEASGRELRGRAETRPEVVEVRSATEVAILDCAIQDPDRGLYDATGERLADIPPVREGQTDLTSAVMILEDGAWKVSDVQGQADVSCDAAPTAQGLPVV